MLSYISYILMGGAVSKKVSEIWFNIFNRAPQIKVLMVGLDCAGKTTILYRFQYKDQVIAYSPFLGFSIQTLNYKNLSLTTFDVGGHFYMRKIWKYYYENVKWVIFVIDSSDRQRIDQAKQALELLLQQEALQKAQILIVANKQDLLNAMSVPEISERLRLNQIISRNYQIIGVSAQTQQGLYQAFDLIQAQNSV